ncbi:hypothetical protein ABRY23_14070 [Melioribacteraceae bacterium 4301-Me]|uniref:hypothetical protein n=1 Tax=Pyranulibacter aquaticus TaxID=3163344 RepID=UPI0035966417
MKTLIMLFSLLTFASGNIFAQLWVYRLTNLSTAGNQIEKINNNNFDYGFYAIGKGTDTTHPVNVYRTYFELSLNSIPTNATIDTVIVNYHNSGSGYTL